MNTNVTQSANAPLDGDLSSACTPSILVDSTDKSKSTFNTKFTSSNWQHDLPEGSPILQPLKVTSSPKATIASSVSTRSRLRSLSLDSTCSDTESVGLSLSSIQVTDASNSSVGNSGDSVDSPPFSNSRSEPLHPDNGDVFGVCLKRLEAIHWENSSTSVASVLGEMLSAVNDLSSQLESSFDMDSPHGDEHQCLRQNIHEELSEINDIFSQYAERHPSICEDETTATTLFEQLQALGYDVEHHRRHVQH